MTAQLDLFDNVPPPVDTRPRGTFVMLHGPAPKDQAAAWYTDILRIWRKYSPDTIPALLRVPVAEAERFAGITGPTVQPDPYVIAGHAWIGPLPRQTTQGGKPAEAAQ